VDEDVLVRSKLTNRLSLQSDNTSIERSDLYVNNLVQLVLGQLRSRFGLTGLH
jgi:hypothetical protein